MAMKANLDHHSGEDPLMYVQRAATRLNTHWLRWTYPFALFGRHTSIHHSVDVRKAVAQYISIGESVLIARDVWLNIPHGAKGLGTKIALGSGCNIGRRSTISARNSIILEADVLLAPSVLIMDHAHQFSDVEKPIHAQGITEGGRISIGRNCWIGHGAVVVCNRGELVLGPNSVLGSVHK